MFFHVKINMLNISLALWKMRFSELIFMILMVMVMVMMIMMTIITRMMNTVNTLQYKHIKVAQCKLSLLKRFPCYRSSPGYVSWKCSVAKNRPRVVTSVLLHWTVDLIVTVHTSYKLVVPKGRLNVSAASRCLSNKRHISPSRKMLEKIREVI